MTADVSLVTDSRGHRYVAKFIYDSQPGAEAGLRVAEQVEANSDLTAGAPLRTPDGDLTVMLPSVPARSIRSHCSATSPARPLRSAPRSERSCKSSCRVMRGIARAATARW